MVSSVFHAVRRRLGRPLGGVPAEKSEKTQSRDRNTGPIGACLALSGRPSFVQRPPSPLEVRQPRNWSCCTIRYETQDDETSSRLFESPCAVAA